MRTFAALINPISGGGRAPRTWAPVARRLASAGADVVVEHTRSREHGVDAAAAAAADGRVVIAVGGDGLVRDVAQGVVPTRSPMAVVAAGRGNDLAGRLDLPRDPDGLARMLLTGAVRELDVIDLGGTVVAGNVYCGLDSVANAIINRSRWMPALLAYRLAPVRAILTWHAPTFTLTTDGAVRTVRAHLVVVGNSGAYGHGLRIVPSARMDDGRLDVLVVGDIPKRTIASFMRAARRGTHVDRPEVEVLTAATVTIAADRAVPVCGDGEELGGLPATMTVRPGALRLIAPASDREG